MFKNIIRIAEINISITTKADFTERFCKYGGDGDAVADMTICTDEEEIRRRCATFSETDERSAESFYVYEKICDELPRYEAFMLHAAVLEYNGRAYAFCAKSGTGKSTHAALWRQLFGDKCRYLNGDKPIIRIMNGVPTAFGTPWNGKEGFGENISAPLSGICRIYRDETSSIRRLSKEEMLFSILPSIHRPKDKALEDSLYAYVGTVVENVPMYELHCNISEEAARLSFEAMTGSYTI